MRKSVTSFFISSVFIFASPTFAANTPVLTAIPNTSGVTWYPDQSGKPVVEGKGIVPIRRSNLKNNEYKVMNNLLQVYGNTDLLPLEDYLKLNPWAGPNAVVPFISMGQAYMNRAIRFGNATDIDQAMVFFEFVSSPDIYANWGQRWASDPTAAYLLCGIFRVHEWRRDNRAEALFARGRVIAETEADLKLTVDFPYKPYISGTPQDGDTKAEENAWTSTILAWASQMYPEHSRAALWEAKGREMALYSIVRGSDQMYINGEQVITVEEDFTLTNHWIRGNPYYTGGTIALLKVAALAYWMTGKFIPLEYNHNVQGLYNNYKKECGYDGRRMVWTQASDPQGDPTIFPLAYMNDDTFEERLVSQKAADGYLWIRTDPVQTIIIDPEKGLTSESSLGTMIQNSKVMWYYLMGSFLWHPGV